MATSVYFEQAKLQWLDISAPVGYSWGHGNKMQVNDHLDVTLVQFMLKRCVESLMRGTALGPPMLVDGKFGMKTHYYTLLFHRAINGVARIDMDGAIEPLDFSKPTDFMKKLNEDFFFSISGGNGVISVKSLFEMLPPQLHQSLRYNAEEMGRPTRGARRG